MTELGAGTVADRGHWVRGNEHIQPRQPRRCVRVVREGYREEMVVKDPNSMKTVASVEGRVVSWQRRENGSVEST